MTDKPIILERVTVDTKTGEVTYHDVDDFRRHFVCFVYRDQTSFVNPRDISAVRRSEHVDDLVNVHLRNGMVVSSGATLEDTMQTILDGLKYHAAPQQPPTPPDRAGSQ